MFKDTIATYNNEVAAAEDEEARQDATSTLFADCAETIIIDAQAMVDAGRACADVSEAAHALMVQAAKDIASGTPDSGCVSPENREAGMLWCLYDALHNEAQYFEADYDGAVHVDWSVRFGDTPANSRLVFKAA